MRRFTMRMCATTVAYMLVCIVRMRNPNNYPSFV